jgi:hypothetical protein
MAMPDQGDGIPLALAGALTRDEQHAAALTVSCLLPGMK